MEPDAWWLAVDTLFVINNFVMANGAKVIGATNFYPDAERWKLLDEDGKYDEAYNRYAHQIFSLVRPETSIDLLVDDSIRINLNAADIKKMKINYIVTVSELKEFLEQYNIYAEEVFEQDGYKIYQLNY